LFDEVAQPPQVVVLPPTVRGRWATADFLEQLRTMCGSRTGGWSLPSVMSD
jgi:hypothetical protein